MRASYFQEGAVRISNIYSMFQEVNRLENYSEIGTIVASMTPGLPGARFNIYINYICPDRIWNMPLQAEYFCKQYITCRRLILSNTAFNKSSRNKKRERRLYPRSL